MKFSERWWQITTLCLLNHWFVFIGETLENVVKFVFMIEYLPKERQLIKTRRETLEVFIHCLSLLSPLLDLIEQLFDMTKCGFSIC